MFVHLWIKKEGNKVAVLSTGTIGNTIFTLDGNFTHAHFPFIKPLDTKNLEQILKTHSTIITYEEGMIKGGFGQQIMHYAQKNNFQGRIIIKGYPDHFIEHGAVHDLNKKIGFNKNQIHTFIKSFLIN